MAQRRFQWFPGHVGIQPAGGYFRAVRNYLLQTCASFVVQLTGMARRAIRTLIVDDEPIARHVLREQLDAIPEVVVVGEAENGRQTLQQIAELQPDLVFLDLQMPVMGGFEVVRKLGGGHLPVIVIVTAFDQHAIEAFEAGAVDYLLKPVSEARLRRPWSERESCQNLMKSPTYGVRAERSDFG